MSEPLNSLEKQLNAIEELDPLESRASVNQLIGYCESRFVEARFRAAEALGEAVTHRDVVDTLIRMLDDPSAHARLAAAEALVGVVDSNVEKAVIRRLGVERDLYVKCFLVLVLGGFKTDRSRAAVELQLQKSRRNALKLRCYYSLYKMGDYDRIEDILRVLNTKDYRARSAAVGYLEEIIKGRFSTKVLEALKARHRIEEARAVKLRLADVISKVEEDSYSGPNCDS